MFNLMINSHCSLARPGSHFPSQVCPIQIIPLVVGPMGPRTDGAAGGQGIRVEQSPSDRVLAPDFHYQLL